MFWSLLVLILIFVCLTSGRFDLFNGMEVIYLLEEHKKGAFSDFSMIYMDLS